jgi:hypothetical protein
MANARKVALITGANKGRWRGNQEAAPLELPEGGKTGVDLALLGEDGPSGGYFHLGKRLPW